MRFELFNEDERIFTDDVLEVLLKDKINEEYEKTIDEQKERELDRKRKSIDALVYQIKRVVFNKNATIVFWNTGEKTVVKCQKGETFDKEKGVALCILKYLCGNISYYNEIFKSLNLDESFDEKGEPKAEYVPNKKAVKKGIKAIINRMFL